MRYLFLAALCMSVAGLSSCCKKRVSCERESLNIAFTGFDRSIVRNITLKRYVKGDTERKKALDSATYINSSNVTVVAGKPDTVWLSSYNLSTGTAFGIQYGNDYVLTITSFNRSFLIADIYEGDNRYQKVPCKDNDTKCANTIKSYSVDGFWVESNKLYIRR